jgi:hypothetical protein
MKCIGFPYGIESRNRMLKVKELIKVTVAGVLVCLLAVTAGSQTGTDPGYGADAEFHLARLAYPTYSYANSRGYSNNPMWRVDFPNAELNFLPALSRLTTISVDLSVGVDFRDAIDRLHLEIHDDRIFGYPLLYMQQPGQAGWRPDESEAARLREYLDRGGFLLIDDFHGRDLYSVQEALKLVLPNHEIVEIPGDDPLMNVFFDLGDRLQIPGQRHLGGGFRRGGRGSGGGEVQFYMEGPPYWLGIYDDRDRLIVGINYNIDMGDAWEHADDAFYPAPMTGQAYRLGVNYVIYAMTH